MCMAEARSAPTALPPKRTRGDDRPLLADCSSS